MVKNKEILILRDPAPDGEWARARRIAIAGGPGAGKTTLAAALGRDDVLSTDDFMHWDWEDVPSFVEVALANRPTWVLEGVQVARCLRFWWPDVPADVVVWLSGAHEPLSRRQAGMGRGVARIFEEWERVVASK